MFKPVKGPIVCSLAAYESYYQQRAQLWEMQALTRARAICGPSRQEFAEIARTIWRAAGERPDLFGKINDMVERIRRERGSGMDFSDFKAGIGGMIEAEFVIQALQMKNDVWEPNWTAAVAELVGRNLVSASEASALARNYNFLRRCETTLRRWQNSKVDTIPAEQDEQRKFSKRLGYDNSEAFANDYHAARAAIRGFYEQKMKSLML